MKSITLNLYTFDELKPDIQKKVLEEHLYTNVEYFNWYEFTINDQTERLASLGYNDADIRFSGFYSQGDGASFTATVDLATWINQDKKNRAKFQALDKFDISASIIRTTHHYSHENTIRAATDMESDAPETMQDLENELEEAITQEARELSQEIYRTLEEDYNYLTSDECITETIESNEYTFEHDGTMRNV